MGAERLQKILARAGISSRRGAERMIEEGRVTVNGKVITRLGTRADPDQDHIKIDGKLLLAGRQGPRRYFVAFKPRRMITSLADPEGRPTVADLLRAARIRARVFPVGRLDWDADGLLLLTNDGELAQRVLHPRQHMPKTYRVKVKGRPDDRTLGRLRSGVILERGRRTLPAEIRRESELEGASWLQVTLIEGRPNQIKRMFEQVGHPVRRLRRVAIGPLRLGRLRVGQVRELSERELLRLRRATGMLEGDAPVSRRSTRRPGKSRKSTPRP
ncbi:MAG TPA: rRNA pseudouridine synthase [Acidobacteria bacterium]|nr:rRNA pseudouridine synthase [Acidobacteriota bacterium]